MPTTDTDHRLTLTILNSQRAAKLDARAVRRLAKWLLGRAASCDPCSGAWGNVTVVLRDDAGMAEVNRVHLGRESTTDVIVYRYTPQPGEAAAVDGDLLVNVERARVEGRRRRRAWGPDAELALYLAHACDHFAGADDATPAGRRAMRRRELAWLAGARREGLLRGLFAGGRRRPSP